MRLGSTESLPQLGFWLGGKGVGGMDNWMSPWSRGGTTMFLDAT
jgi:hypothetical protein